MPLIAPSFRFILLGLLFGLLAPAPLRAEGINSSPGADLPLGAGGTSVLIITSTGQVSINKNGAPPVTLLDVNGGVRLGAETKACNDSMAGTLSYSKSSPSSTTGNLYICNGSKWQLLSGSSN